MSGHRKEHGAAPVLWLTGVPGVGKTTVIQRVAKALPNQSLGGFCTEEMPARVLAWLRCED